MSAALEEVDGFEQAEQSASKPKRSPRKAREVSNRIVSNFTPEYTWLIKKDADEQKFSPAKWVRLLVAEAYRARGKTPSMVKAEYYSHLAAEATRAAEEEGVGL